MANDHHRESLNALYHQGLTITIKKIPSARRTLSSQKPSRGNFTAKSRIIQIPKPIAHKRISNTSDHNRQAQVEANAYEAAQHQAGNYPKDIKDQGLTVYNDKK